LKMWNSDCNCIYKDNKWESHMG